MGLLALQSNGDKRRHVVLLSPPAGALSWTAAGGSSPVPSVPGRVQALAGSCVVVPCSFPPLAAPLRRGGGRVEVRLKFTGGRRFPSRSTAFNSEDPRHVAGEYLRRTSLHGRISEGDCSLRLEPVRLQDSRAFEVALKGPEEGYWGTPRAFTLEVSGGLKGKLYLFYHAGTVHINPSFSSHLNLNMFAKRLIYICSSGYINKIAITLQFKKIIIIITVHYVGNVNTLHSFNGVSLKV